MYEIISSGSTGNAILYFNTILVDCGIPYSLLSKHIKGLSLVLLTHEHGDHLNLSTIKRLSFERPALRFGCGKFLDEHLTGIRNIDVYEAGRLYNYGPFQISPVSLYHDCPNFGYRIYRDGKKILHATDTAHLKGITAKGYDLYALEANYDDEHVLEVIAEKDARGQYAHQRGSINSHLSVQQAQNFVLENGNENSKFVILHQSKEF